MNSLRLFLTILVLATSSGCTAVSYYANSYGEKMPAGAVVQIPGLRYKLPFGHLRVSSSNEELIAYEDFGMGLSRGRVFVVRKSTKDALSNLIEDLSQFGASPARVLKIGKLASVQTHSWRGEEVSLHLLNIPEIRSGSLVEREQIWVLGLVCSRGDARYWISLTSSDEFFDSAQPLGSRNIKHLFEFAEGLEWDA